MRHDQPIIDSLLLNDLYKWTMARVLLARGLEATPVVYGLNNRTKSARLGDTVPLEALRDEISNVRFLRYRESEIEYLRDEPRLQKLSVPYFRAAIAQVELPLVETSVDADRILQVRTGGRWIDTIWWETILLPIINELHFRTLMARDGTTAEKVEEEGVRRLMAKIERLRRRPSIKIMEFGNRRRFSLRWQRRMLGILLEELPGQVLGTSNVLLAKEYGVAPLGTIAHEMFMVYAAIARANGAGLVESHNRVLRDYGATLGYDKLFPLTDTYGTDFCLRDLSPEQVAALPGLRQDSGDPFEMGEKVIAFYQRLNVDPRTKTIVFSDGLDIDMIERLHDRFEGRIGTLYGWGTDLTNDLGYKPLSLVIKAIEACGLATVKLSDNPAKATGPADLIEEFQRAFGHVTGTYRECIR